VGPGILTIAALLGAAGQTAPAHRVEGVVLTLPGARSLAVIASTEPEPPPRIDVLAVPDDGLTPPPAQVDSAVRPAAYLAPEMVAPSAPRPGPASSVSIELTGPATAPPDKPLRYQMLARNPGVVPVDRVRVEQELPAGARLIRAEPVPEVQSQRLVWNLGYLEAGAERRLSGEIESGAGNLNVCPIVSYAAMVGLRTHWIEPVPPLRLEAPTQARR
jgi:hypothetical protein